MAGPFDITAPTNTVLLDSKRQATTAFTVANRSGRQIRGRALLVALNQQAQSWLTLTGDAERDFVIAGTQQYTVAIAAPADAPVGAYSFRLNAVGVDNPDEELSEGPVVQFTIPAPVAQQKSFPIWIPIAIVAALLLIGVAVFAIAALTPPAAPSTFTSVRPTETNTALPTDTPVATNTFLPTATITPVATNTPLPTATITPVPTSTFTGAQFPMPAVADLGFSVARATSILESYGLTVSVKRANGYIPNDMNLWVVVFQDPAPGKPVRKGDTVTITYGYNQ